MRRVYLTLGAGCGNVLAFYDTGDAQPQAPSALSKLPEVTDVLEPSSDTITRLQSQVIALNSRIKDIAGNEKAKVASAKLEMESKLGNAQQDLEKAQSQNDQLRDQNAKLFQDASKLEKHAREVLDENQGLREILDSLKDKVRMGASFISKMEADADWTGAKELEVLKVDTTDSLDDLEEEDMSSSSPNGVTVTKGHRRTSGVVEKKDVDVAAQKGVKFLDGKLVKFGQQSAAKEINGDEKSAEVLKKDSDSDKKKASSAVQQKSTSGQNKKGESDEDEEEETSDEEKESSETSEQAAEKAADETEEEEATDKTNTNTNNADESADEEGVENADAENADENQADADASPAATSFLALRSEERTRATTKSGQHAEYLSDPGEQNLNWMHAAGDTPASPAPADADSSSMLSVLHSELRQLKQQENASIRTLALAFEKKAKLLRRDKEKVLRLQSKLLRKQNQLKHHKKRLEEAVSYVENTKKQLSQSLAQLGGYLRDLAHIALAPPKESGKILPNLNVELDSHEGLVRKDGS